MPDLRRRIRSADTPTRADISIRSVFRWTSRVAFLALLAFGILLTVTADMILLTIVGSIFVVQALYAILPVKGIRARFRRLYTGQTGEDVYEEIDDRRDGGGRFR